MCSGSAIQGDVIVVSARKRKAILDLFGRTCSSFAALLRPRIELLLRLVSATKQRSVRLFTCF